MAKFVSRKIDVYQYVFGNFDLQTGTATDLHTYESGYKLSAREVTQMCEKTGCTLLGEKKVMREYKMPINRFIEVCAEYQDEKND